ncbi:MAG: terpene cyclase/mutase family protein [Planctomycetaceae bacterium]|nr:terpene cyclase/mutase family protein [Planctomycetaceae bacterium]
MFPISKILCRWLSSLCVLALTLPLMGQDALPTSKPEFEETKKSIDRALKFLVSQQKESGAITLGQHDTAMTALSIMAMASVGVTPSQDDERGRAMSKAIDFVLEEKRQNKEGYFGEADGSRMYGHGIITLMLSEMVGMGRTPEQDARIHDACQKGIDLILNAQRRSKSGSNRGGWRYTPDASDADLSVSVWQLMALRSAKTDGLDVPPSAIEQAIIYLKRSCTSPLDGEGKPVRQDSGFAYTPGSGDIQYAMTAAGALAMQVCGQYESPLVRNAIEWLKKHPPKWGTRYFFYGTYYYAQALHQQGGETADEAERLVRDVLLPKQNEDGGWTPEGEEGGAGRVYATSMAILSLSVRFHYLPIYQR